MALSALPSKIPNTEKLFMYLQKEQWQNVSANFSGFVKKEFEAAMKHLEEDEENFKELKMMIDYAEMGRYNDAKTLLEPAHKEYEELESYLRNGYRTKPRQRPVGTPIANENRHQTYTPAKSLPGTPKRPGSDTYGDKRETYSPVKRDMPNQQRSDLTPNIAARQPREEYSPRHRHEVGDRSSRTPQKVANQSNTYDDHHRDVGDRSSRTPQKGSNQQNAYDDPHRRNYDSLRLGSPEKDKLERPGSNHPSERENSSKFGQRHLAPTTFDQHASSRDMWRRNDGEKPKPEYSTYRQEYPEYVIDHVERQDRNRYRDNFGSASEKDFMHYPDSQGDYREEFRKLHRLQDTPDNDIRPSELARRFKDIYAHEWTDAYDELVKGFGSLKQEESTEKSVKNLLWIVTEAYLIANEIADDQLRHLEERSYGVMTGPPQEAWLIALELGDKQLRDLEKSTFSIMSRPGSEHLRNVANSRDLGESLPTSRHLLVKYRKQTAALSVPYVKEQIRTRICRTLLENFGFPKMYLTDASRVVAYINKCAEIVWLMSVQDPPVVLEYITKETEGARFNTEHYHTYTSPGTIYKYGVWPLLRLDKRGPVLSKGIAQGVQ